METLIQEILDRHLPAIKPDASGLMQLAGTSEWHHDTIRKVIITGTAEGKFDHRKLMHDIMQGCRGTLNPAMVQKFLVSLQFRMLDDGLIKDNQ